MKRQKPQKNHRESIDLGCAIFSSVLFHVVLFLVLASTSIFYPAVGSAMRFDYIWLDPYLAPKTAASEQNTEQPAVLEKVESTDGAILQKSEVIPPQQSILPVAPEEPPEATDPEDDVEAELEIVPVRQHAKRPDPAPVKPLPATKQTIDLKAEREQRLAEEARLKAARAEAERLRLSVERSRRELLARERTEQMRKVAEESAALKLEQERIVAEEARIKAAQADAERVREAAEQARLERLAHERAELKRQADEQAAALKLEQERIAAEEARLQAAQKEAERLRQVAERARKERIAREKADQKRRAAEQAARLKAAEEQKAAEAAQLKAKQIEAERLRQAEERARQERLSRQQAEELRSKAELAAKHKADMERQAAEDARRISAREEAERSRRAAERARQERLASEQVEERHKAAELAARAKAEQERLAQEKAGIERTAALHKVAVVAAQQASGSKPMERSQGIPVTSAATGPVEKKPPIPKPEIKGIVIPAVNGDLKLVITSKSPVKIAATFRAFPKSRRNRPQTLNEARQEKNITPLIVTPGNDTQEAVIESAHEGIYTFFAEPGDATTPKPGFTLKIFESSVRARTRPIGNKTVSGKTVVTRVLMPDGILWEDESSFTGSIEDSNSITKFNAETGLIWKEFNH
ncbi:MAG: hypothetical protein CXR31_06085 [Geobacter sp.]|nr:MAG: hypothetical protein CXR31_06085 [Geobacter sp.]